MENLNEAIVLFLGFKTAKFPQSDAGAVIKKFGESGAIALLAEINRLFDALSTIKIDWNRHSLAEAGEIIRDEMRRRFPSLSEPAVEALAWRFTFNMR